MSWRTPDKILARWEREAGLARGIARGSSRTSSGSSAAIHVAPMDAEAIGNDNLLLKKGADAKGWNVIGNLRNQAHCVGSNRCAFGCPTGAKQSALVTSVPRALHHGARISPTCRVDAITRHGKRATGVVSGTVRGTGHRLAVRAKLVVAAAGAIHTPALLVRSGLRTPSGQLGHNLSMHPNVKGCGDFPTSRSPRGRGRTRPFQVREFQDQGLVFAAIKMPPSILAMSFPHRGAGSAR